MKGERVRIVATVELARSDHGVLRLCRHGGVFFLEMADSAVFPKCMNIDAATARKLKGRRKWVKR